MADAKVVGHRVSAVKASAQAFTANTTLADLTDLTFKVKAGQTWKIRAKLFVTTTGATPNFKFTVDGPASPTTVFFQPQSLSALNGTPATPAIGTIAAFGAGAALNATFTSATNPAENVLLLEGYIVNGVNDGTFSVQGAQAVSDAATVTVKAGSFIEAELIS